MNPPFSILYEDPHCLVVSKPNGVLTQFADNRPGEISLEDQIRLYLQESTHDEQSYLGTIHRLDKPVSGVIVWAKTPRAARRLAKDFEGRRVAKVYWAIVEGSPSEPSGEWIDWLGPDPAVPSRMIVGGERPDAKRAVTRFEIGERSPSTGEDETTSERRHTRLILRPETGRSHQLRVQTSARGTPIVGDIHYGSTADNLMGIALHARSLSFRHPQTYELMTFQAEVPAWWRERRFPVHSIDSQINE